jgi:hypothetical protein
VYNKLYLFSIFSRMEIFSKYYWILIIFIAIIALALFLKNREEDGENNDLNLLNYKRKLYFFSYHELELCKLLSSLLQSQYWEKYDIFPKVRLADIFEPTDWKKWISKIVSKHVDFLIVNCQNHADPVLAIELNWESHNSYVQAKSDEFKNRLFSEKWLKLITIHNNEVQNHEKVKEIIISSLE